MSQKKYIMSAILLIVVGVVIYLGLKKFPQGKDAVDSNTAINDNKLTNNLTKVEIEGKRLYESICLSCHGSFKKNDGPRQLFSGFQSRWPDKKELFAFIRNPEEVMKRNAYARELKNKYGTLMIGFPKLSDEQIQAILDHINREMS